MVLPSQSSFSSSIRAEEVEDRCLRRRVEEVVDLLGAGAEAELRHRAEEVELQGPEEEGEVMTSFQTGVVHPYVPH